MVFKKYIQQLSQLPELEEDCGHLLVGKDQQQLTIKPELWAVTSGHLDSLPTLLIEPHEVSIRRVHSCLSEFRVDKSIADPNESGHCPSGQVHAAP